jgi:hypothetical protein
MDGLMIEVDSRMRSEPGQGKEVGIYLMDRTDDYPEDSRYFNQEGCFSLICGGTGEDFSTCGWAVCVKVQRDVSQDDLAHHLEELARAVRGGFYIRPSGLPTSGHS